MATINGRACVVNSTPVDKVFSDGRQVYGRNLITGTSNELTTITISGWGTTPYYEASGTYGASSYYASAYIENTTPVGINIYVHLNGRTGNFYGNTIQPGKSGVSSCVFDILEGQSLSSMWVGFSSSQTQIYTYKYKEVMLKHTPTPWTPAPEDYI